MSENNKKEYTLEEICKWAALFECLWYVDRYAKQKNLDGDKMITKIKPSHIKQYIASRFPIIENQVLSNDLENSDFFTEFITN